MKVATVAQSDQEVVDNVLKGMEGLADKVPRKWGGVQSVHLKTADSLALPLYTALPLGFEDKGSGFEEEGKNEKEKREKVVKDGKGKGKGKRMREEEDRETPRETFTTSPKKSRKVTTGVCVCMYVCVCVLCVCVCMCMYVCVCVCTMSYTENCERRKRNELSWVHWICAWVLKCVGV